METPFNENLVLSNQGCGNPVLNPLLACTGLNITPFSPGWRNEFHAGLQQAFGKYLVFSGEYIWKYTHNAYDFSVLGATPITFPIEWDRSKIPGYAGRVSVPNFHGFTGLVVFSSVAARFFTPQIGGAGAVPAASGPFRIDHDEKFNLTGHMQYQPWKLGPWFGFNWRYDSGLVAGPAPCAGGNCANGPGGYRHGRGYIRAKRRSTIRSRVVLRIGPSIAADPGESHRDIAKFQLGNKSVPGITIRIDTPANTGAWN